MMESIIKNAKLEDLPLDEEICHNPKKVTLAISVLI